MRAFRVRPGRGGIPVRRLVHAGVAQGGLHLHGPIPGSGLPAVATPRAFHVFRRVGFRQKIEGKKQQQPPAQQEGNTETLMTGLQAHGAASRGGGGASTASDELQTVQKENVDLLSRIERLLGTSLRFIDSRWNISEPVLKLPPPPPVEKPVAHVNLLRSSLTASFAELATDHQPQPQPQPPPAVRTPLPPLPPTTIAATATGEQEQTESSVLHSHSAEDVTTPEPPRPPSEAIGDVQDSAIEPSPQVSDGTAQRGTVPSSPPLPAPPHAGDAESGDLETHTQRSLSHSRGDEGSLPPVASTEAQASAAGELLSEPTPTIPPPAPTTSQPLSDRIEADSAGWPMGACEGALATDSPVSEVDTETVSVAADLQPVTDTSALSETLPHGDAEETAQIPIAEPPTLQADTGDAHATAAVSAATAPQSVFEELQPSRTVTAQAVYMATAGYMPFPTSVPAPNMEAMRSLPRLLALAWVWGSRFAARWGLPSQASPVSTSQPRRESCTAHGGKEDEGQVLAPATVMAGVQGSNDNSTNATASTLPPAPEDAADPALTSALMGLRGILELHARGLLSPGDYRSLGTNSRAQWLLQIVQTRVDALEVPEVLLVLQAMGIMDTTGKMALTDLLVEQFFYRWSPRSASAGTAVQALLSRLPEFGSAYALPVEASLLLAQSSDPQAPLLLLRRLRSRDAARMRLPWASAKCGAEFANLVEALTSALRRDALHYDEPTRRAAYTALMDLIYSAKVTQGRISTQAEKARLQVVIDLLYGAAAATAPEKKRAKWEAAAQ